MTKTAPADSPTQHKSNPFTSFAAQVIYGLIIGLILGFISRSFDIEWLESTLTAVGSAYVTLLKVLIPPLVITAVLTSIANLRQVTNAARLAWQTLLWFAITSLASVVVATIVALVLKPGVNTTVDASSAAAPSGQGSWLGFLQSIVPSNILGLSARATDSGVSLNFNILQILVLSIACLLYTSPSPRD